MELWLNEYLYNAFFNSLFYQQSLEDSIESQVLHSLQYNGAQNASKVAMRSAKNVKQLIIIQTVIVHNILLLIYKLKQMIFETYKMILWILLIKYLTIQTPAETLQPLNKNQGKILAKMKPTINKLKIAQQSFKLKIYQTKNLLSSFQLQDSKYVGFPIGISFGISLLSIIVTERKSLFELNCDSEWVFFSA
ncbi:unnamed protein product (macronuclear) [Paramecium tetraurelia]|uniref:Transmembrane protein n=1 Tax=Paramecium tetraurelia TaxID=5888 RepID=A0BYA2_PARTE|nr:uncharacterized protein GSPATT00033372001 [Paramecium tetraurelia]CAK63519.1 unnamed protein product [Paramecium tetraurelia]|eukprot:XP_001430917.1 hypothetical protein (macronuclear) [Paramecium tetraurelia strain d4-2]